MMRHSFWRTAGRQLNKGIGILQEAEVHVFGARGETAFPLLDYRR